MFASAPLPQSKTTGPLVPTWNRWPRRVFVFDTCIALCYTWVMPTPQTAIRFTPRDRELLAQVRERYGISTDADAIRLALRVALAHAPTVPPPIERKEKP